MNATLYALPVHQPRETPAPTGATTSPTQAQQIAGERAAGAAKRIERITSSPFITAQAKAQAQTLRRDLERFCGELRRAGL